MNDNEEILKAIRDELVRLGVEDEPLSDKELQDALADLDIDEDEENTAYRCSVCGGPGKLGFFDCDTCYVDEDRWMERKLDT
jgi:hypothetical protein